MTPERWQQVREVLGQVLELASEQRFHFLENSPLILRNAGTQDIYSLDWEEAFSK